MTQWLRLSAAMIALAAPALAQDTVRVRADGAPLWGTDVRLVKDFAIGQIDGPPEYAFGSVEYIASRRDGSFYLYDGKAVQIRQYDAGGKFVRTIGRKGAGPGEYQQVLGLGLIDSTLVVWDGSGARVSFFAANGSFARSFSAGRAPTFASNAISVDTAGLISILFSGGFPEHEPAAGSIVVSGGQITHHYLRFRATGQLADSMPIPPESQRERSFLLILPEGGRWSFADKTITVPNQAGGIVVGYTGANRYVVAQGKGRVVSVERAHRPVSLTDGERAEWLAFADDFRRMGRGSTTYSIPRVKPAFRDLMTDPSGRVWAEVYVAAEQIALPPAPSNTGRPRLTWRERTTYDVFAPAGTYLGKVILPHKTALIAIQGNRLWLQSKGEADEDIISVWHMDGIASR